MENVIKKITSNYTKTRGCIIVKNKDIKSLVHDLRSIGAVNQHDNWVPLDAETAKNDFGDSSLVGHYFLQIQDEGGFEFCIHENDRNCIVEYV